MAKCKKWQLLSHTSKAKIRSRKFDMNKFLSFEEISEHVGIPLRTLYYLQKQGLAPVAYKFGKAYRVHISDYANWLVLNRVPMR
jgi:predicted DNA-binding transcriptional regulator AlpA